MKFTKETARRAVRTFFQAVIGIVAAGIATVDFSDGTTVKTALFGLCASAIAGGLSAIMNLESEDE